eukprot:CAMPEP_0197530174 /NCGR_PEP_ID=MMETSP1318-20131121/30952_1 /TAXON_ID=552666 /ORGANISM="Partenskyella glossopodia, Strain RCC365" /LENGTH=364 /DNA_ID=CAMNT_0043085891 /DNA_START=304 /DNA_END=1400 /DNA_ORIENTATION=-
MAGKPKQSMRRRIRLRLRRQGRFLEMKLSMAAFLPAAGCVPSLSAQLHALPSASSPSANTSARSYTSVTAIAPFAARSLSAKSAAFARLAKEVRARSVKMYAKYPAAKVCVPLPLQNARLHVIPRRAPGLQEAEGWMPEAEVPAGVWKRLRRRGGSAAKSGTDVESQEACFRSRHGQDQRKAAEGRAGEAAEKQRETVGRRECCTCEHLRNLHAAYKEASSTQNNANSASVRAAHKGGKHHSGSHHSSSSHHHNNHNHKSDMHSFPSFLEVHHEFQFRLQNKLKQNLECCPCSSAETNIAKSDLSPMRLTMEPEVRVVARFRELLPAEDEGHDVKAAMREISGEAEDNIYVNPNYVKQKLVALE